MDRTPDILSAEQMKQRYSSFYETSPKVRLDQSKVPQRLWPLLAYAEFWGIADDLTREILVKQAPADVRHNLKEVVTEFDAELEDWLTGPEANNADPSDEYVAFAALVMAADYV